MTDHTTAATTAIPTATATATASESAQPQRPLQPLLQGSVVALRAPSQAWSAPSGEMGDAAIDGFAHSETRVLRSLRLRIDGAQPEHIATAASGASDLTFVSLVRNVDDRSADPRVRLDRHRTVSAGELRERLVLSSTLHDDVPVLVELTATPEFGEMQHVKAGLPQRSESLRWDVDDAAASVSYEAGLVRGRIDAPGAGLDVGSDGETSMRWNVTIPAKGTVTVDWSIVVVDDGAAVSGVSTPWDVTAPATDDPRLTRWMGAALADLDALRLTTTAAPGEAFLAAGAPWFFTLFGRDSLWAARLLLPVTHGIAASTLRVLAGLQGTASVDATAEQPGKIMHELRPGVLEIPGEDVSLPPLYYGTIDATPLWACVLHDAWRAGMPEDEVRALLPALEAALSWMRDFGDSDGDGYLEYVDTTGHGLANQGWKDSGDSIQWNDGSLADGPIALCEVQGYAYEAAVHGADLLEAFGRPGATEWRAWGAELRERFNRDFWIDDERGGYPAVALDAAKQRVDTVTSNIGHLLSTGILDGERAAAVAARLVSPELCSGYGLRTLSTEAAGFWPLSYHGGSVWTHDTAIAISGLASAGFGDEAAVLAAGLLDAAEGFDFRMPELHSGDAAADIVSPVPYPAACRPQAWSAAAAIAVHSALAR
ncbi:glycogen debranching N-terminal domain-containing protein [Plantibacter sp. YIM 135347]|uniref:glycogen debranching N-terminal domain-containing protein n=1 Tax=Plantibacter sp. YIM 135347 TaxID=3423919 RepID=UPI003D34FE47